MANRVRVVPLILVVGLVAFASRAQTVAMYGEFHESNGIIGNIPQNPPIIPCVPPPLTVLQLPDPHPTVVGSMSFQHLDVRPTGVADARCHAREGHVNFDIAAPGVFNKPRIGGRGARIIPGGMAPGDPFTIPPFAFGQNLGPQVGIVLRNVVRQLDTTFNVAMPGIDRVGPEPGPLPVGSYTIKTPMQRIPAPALTRMFSSMNWQNPGNGQNNGKPGSSFAARAAADTTHTATAAGGNERVRVRYAAGPRQFGGTMALLLDGRGRMYLNAPGSWTPFLLRPVAATNPLGDDDPGFRLRQAAGWDLTAVGSQRAGKVKAFYGGIDPANAYTPMGDPRVALRCTQTPLPLPVGCNEINGFDTFMAGTYTTGLGLPAGGTIAALPKAISVRHMFALTTGTVSIVRVALRNGIHFSDTLTGMGHDTVALSSMGGPVRQVGLVAGSYAVRSESSTGRVEINAQMLGLNLKFIPEPGATTGLASALGVLALLARSRQPRLFRPADPCYTPGRPPAIQREARSFPWPGPTPDRVRKRSRNRAPS